VCSVTNGHIQNSLLCVLITLINLHKSKSNKPDNFVSKFIIKAIGVKAE